jgi:hypothetical protein
MRRRALLTTLVLLALSGCGGGDGDEQAQDTSGGDQDEGDSETGDPQVTPGDSCEQSLLVTVPTTLVSTLRGASPSSFEPSCGATGPVVYLRVQLEARGDLTIHARGRGYTPRLAVQLPGCVSAADDPARLLGCVDALPLTFMDIGPDTELSIAVGIADDDPALAELTDEPDPLAPLDPLEFEIRFDLRAVLAEGQACGSGQGRCEAGTVCLFGDEGDGVQLERCRRPAADSCVAPGQLAVPEPGAAIELVIPPDEPHSDAHEHTCTGWRRPDRVEQLELPALLPANATLVVRADDPRVGLALRDSSCLPELALACTPALATGSQTVLTWGGDGELSALAGAGGLPLLFIELPRSDGEATPITPITVSVEIQPN